MKVFKSKSIAPTMNLLAPTGALIVIVEKSESESSLISVDCITIVIWMESESERESIQIQVNLAKFGHQKYFASTLKVPLNKIDQVFFYSAGSGRYSESAGRNSPSSLPGKTKKIDR